MRYRASSFIAVVLGLLCGTAAFPRAPAPREATLRAILANDNTHGAGRLAHGVLHLALSATNGTFYPDGPGAVGLPVEAFAEEGGAPSIPGPFVRVPLGTRVDVSIHNTLAHALVVRGLGTPQAGFDSALRIAPGGRRTTSFVLDRAGLYGYYGADHDTTIDNRMGDDAELSGAILVEPRGAPRVDHIFVLGLYDRVNTAHDGPNFLYMLETINGRSFPATEHLTYRRGEHVRWGVFNASAMVHPMHLHGFYFKRDADDASDEVTHAFHPGEAGVLGWTADRPGRWMFHCHISDHISPHVPLAAMLAPPASAAHITPELITERFHLPDRPMGGMVVAVDVTGSARRSLPPAHLRRLVLTVAAHDEPGAPYPGFRRSEVTLDDGFRRVSSSGDVGPTIVVRRGENLAIAVRNQLTEQTSIHWHGIALEDSYYDGGAGMDAMSAAGSMQAKLRMSPPIEPGATFVARFTPPEAGTFMYHAHMDDGWQQASGIEGALIVLPPGARADDPADHVVMLSNPFLKAGSPFVAIDGSLQPDPIVMRAGIVQRVRLLCLTLGGENLVASLSEGDRILQWQPLAKDGADLPQRLRTGRPATTALTIGETRDFAFIPSAPGALRLRIYDNDNNGMLVGTLPIEVIAP